MSFLTVVGGRIETDSSTQLGELDFGMLGELAGKKKGFFSKWKKKHMKVASFVNPVFIHKRHIEMIKKKLAKRKAKKKGKKGKGGGDDSMTEQSAVDTGAPLESVVPAGLQPPNTNPFSTESGPMSPGTYPMAPMYPSPMQPPMEYPSQQFPQAYPGGGGGGGEQPYYAPQRQDSMPQFIDTDEESKWQPPNPMYSGPSAYENDPGQRGTEIQQSRDNPFNTGENEYASGNESPSDDFAQGSNMDGYLVSGGGGSWEDRGWGGMSGEREDAVAADLRAQAKSLEAMGQYDAARELENQARFVENYKEPGPNWLLWGGIGLAVFLLLGKK